MAVIVLHMTVILIHTIHKVYICMKSGKHSCLVFVELYALVVIWFPSLFYFLYIFIRL